jgi:large conductance mechanosensitive channel
MSVLSEFKAFALKGNVMDLAVGVIIGAAFGKIVDSLVNDVLMPLLGKVFGVVDFSDLYIKLGPTPSDIVDNYETLKKAGVSLLAYGHFLTIVVNFILLAFVVFLMVKQMNKLKGELPAPSTPEDIALLREIRDSLNR